MKMLFFALSLTLGGGGAATDIPTPRRNIGELHAQFVESIEDGLRRAALDEITRTPPDSMRDVKWLFDLFMRFPEPAVRDAVMASIRLLDDRSAHLEPAFIEYIKLPESEAKVFGINGALRLRVPRALPLITEIARRRFSVKSPGETPVLSDRNAWWAQYEALSALAQWQGAKVLPLLRRKAGEAPSVARLMALNLWKESLPQIVSWANSGGSGAEKAHEALTANVPIPDLRATRAEMLKIVRDRKSDSDLRHQLALKVGFCSTDEEIDALLAEQEASPDPQTRLMLSAALFASRNPRTIPWLKKVALENPDPKTRIGALLQLRLMLPPAEHRALVEQAAARDPDPDNRQTAGEMLKAPPAP